MRANLTAMSAILIGTHGMAAQAQTLALPASAAYDLEARLTAFDPAMPSLSGAVAWINSPPLRAADLRGSVVVVQFWTYTCINWLRTMPYTRAWVQKYQRDGLTVIGVHSPEFEFERDADRVRSAASTLSLGYPIAVDSNHALWRAFGNAYWPALYIIDSRGRIRHRQNGEGGYAESERVIQQLLRESGRTDVPGGLVAVVGQGAEAAPDVADLRSPETYLGYARAERFASPDRLLPDRRRHYGLPQQLQPNRWALAGDWIAGKEAVMSASAGGRVAIRFHARDVHLVMGAGQPGGTVRFRVLIDGMPPAASHGIDVDGHGIGTLAQYRLYQLIRQTGRIKDHVLEIEFLDPGAAAFSFTFG